MRKSWQYGLVLLLVVLMVISASPGAVAEPTVGKAAVKAEMQVASTVVAAPLVQAGELASAVTAETRAARTQESNPAKVLNLDDPRIELSAVAVVSPEITGTGGAFSYELTKPEASRRAWADVGVLRYDSDTDFFLSLSTNIPFGGATLDAHARLMGGWLFNAKQPFFGVRTTF